MFDASDDRAGMDEQCERLVVTAWSRPLVSSLVTGLARAGCRLNLARHVSCEQCRPGLAGGFDRESNQVVICSNVCRDLQKVETILAHELVHMYDHCVNKMDWTNPHHLACSEVRAAALTQCAGPVAAWWRDGGAGTILASQHQHCVRHRAARSLMQILQCGEVDAAKAVQEVFSRCYRDTEPVGRFRCHWEAS